MKREEIAQQILEERKLRRYVRKAIKVIKERKNRKLTQEQKLRKYIRALIQEANTGVSTETPHKSTGINALATLLKNIIPTLENEYKQLTTSPTQRESFRAHILRGVQNVLAPIDAVNNLGKPALPALAEAIDIGVGDDAGKFIPARQADFDQEKEAEEAAEEEKDTFGIEGQDETGRNFAERAFDKVENQIMDAYQALPAEEDKEAFYDYLLTNLKLYFDKFEDELAKDLEEPTTAEYESLKGQEEQQAV
jgi:hypothetical protein